MELIFPIDKKVKIVNWKVKEGNSIFQGNVIFDYIECGEDGDSENQAGVRQKFKATMPGVIRKIMVPKGSCVAKGEVLLSLDPVDQCTHPIVLHDMCGVCSQDLRKLDEQQSNSASVAMVHSVPGLKVSMEEAQMLGKLDEQHLIKERKLVLLVDLDQTLIHTTNDNVPHNLESVFHFQLRSHGSVWYHTRLRPGTHDFLNKINKLFQLHICTFGTRQYANTIAHYLDPKGQYFSDRILSRDECFSHNSKTANLKELFPRGDHMVCIIDDREDVWSFATNLIHVKPYHFFRHTGDINAPPGLTKKDDDDKVGFEFPEVKKESNNKEPVKENSKSLPENKAEVQTTESSVPPKSDPDVDSTTKEELEAGEIVDQDDDSMDVSMDVKEIEDGKDDALDEVKQIEDGKDDSTDEVKQVEDGKDSSPVADSSASNSSPVLEEQKVASSDDTVAVGSSTNNEVIGETDIADKKSDDLIQATSTKKSTCENEEKKVDADTDVKESLEGKDRATVNESNGSSKEGEQKESDVTPEVDSQKKQKPEDEKSDSSDVIKVEDPDDYLYFLERILLSIHRAYYELYDDMVQKGKPGVPDVKTVIPYVRRKVLKGASVVFSGVIPTQVQLEKSRQYAIAVSLGAHVSSKIIPPPKPGSTSKPNEPPTTHLIAAREGTAKVNEARKRYKSIHIVTPDWLWSCAERWEKSDERVFHLFKQSKFKRNPPAHCSSPEQLGKQIDAEDFNSLENTAVPSTDVAGPSTSRGNPTAAARKARTPSGRFMDTINPLLSFSLDELENMDHEVDDIFNESDSSSSTEDEGSASAKKANAARKKKAKQPQVVQQVAEVDKDSTSNDDTGTETENPGSTSTILGKRKRSPTRTETETEDEPLSTRFRRGEPLPSDLDTLNLLSGSSDEDDNNAQMEQDDWMAEALEREFLDENSQDTS